MDTFVYILLFCFQNLYHVFLTCEMNTTSIHCVHFMGLCKQVAQWATITHLRASIMFGDTIIYDALRQITLNLKQ